MFDKTKPCDYHQRVDCKACYHLNMAVLAESKDAISLRDSQFEKALENEESGK